MKMIDLLEQIAALHHSKIHTSVLPKESNEIQKAFKSGNHNNLKKYFTDKTTLANRNKVSQINY